MPLSFEPNQGQLREKVRFFAAGGRSALYLAEDEAVFALRESAASTTLSVGRMRIVGARPEADAVGEEELFWRQ